MLRLQCLTAIGISFDFLQLLAAVDILIVWGTILWMMVAIWTYYRWVALAQVPYFVWVSIATLLQLSITWWNW